LSFLNFVWWKELVCGMRQRKSGGGEMDESEDKKRKSD
jgi:hypothetical protein